MFSRFSHTIIRRGANTARTTHTVRSFSITPPETPSMYETVITAGGVYGGFYGMCDSVRKFHDADLGSFLMLTLLQTTSFAVFGGVYAVTAPISIPLTIAYFAMNNREYRSF